MDTVYSDHVPSSSQTTRYNTPSGRLCLRNMGLFAAIFLLSSHRRARANFSKGRRIFESFLNQYPCSGLLHCAAHFIPTPSCPVNSCTEQRNPHSWCFGAPPEKRSKAFRRDQFASSDLPPGFHCTRDSNVVFDTLLDSGNLWKTSEGYNGEYCYRYNTVSQVLDWSLHLCLASSKV